MGKRDDETTPVKLTLILLKRLVDLTNSINIPNIEDTQRNIKRIETPFLEPQTLNVLVEKGSKTLSSCITAMLFSFAKACELLSFKMDFLTSNRINMAKRWIVKIISIIRIQDKEIGASFEE